MDSGNKEYYQICLNEEMLATLLSVSIFIVFVFLTACSFILYWPEQPYLLAFLIAATMYTAHSSINSGLSYLSLLPDDLVAIKGEFDKKYKSVRDLEKVINKEIEDELEAERSLKRRTGKESSVGK